MSVTVRIPPAMRSLSEGADELSVDASTVGAAFDALEAAHPGFKERLCDAEGRVLRFVNVFVGDEDIRMLDDLETELKDGDVISLLPAMAGG